MRTCSLSVPSLQTRYRNPEISILSILKPNLISIADGMYVTNLAVKHLRYNICLQNNHTSPLMMVQTLYNFAAEDINQENENLQMHR